MPEQKNFWISCPRIGGHCALGTSTKKNASEALVGSRHDHPMNRIRPMPFHSFLVSRQLSGNLMYIKPKVVNGLILSTLCIISLSNRCDAQLYSVEFNDPDGPHWTGIVDTARNSLDIETWTENPGGMSFWTLQDLPADWGARTVVNSLNTQFDIPFNWDGTIDDNWGFTPFNNISQLNWNEGVYTELGIATGWGAGCGTISSLDTSGSESDMFCLPTGETTVGDAVGTATVTDLQTRFSVVSGDFFAPGNWDNGTPGPATNAVIANGGTATATTGALQLLQATVGDMRSGGDGALESNGVSIDIERDLAIASLVRDAAIGDQTCNGILTVSNADLFEVGDQARFETLVANTIGGGDQVLDSTGSLSIENVATVNMRTLEAGGTDEPINATYGNSNQTTDADVSITNAENVSIFEDLELAKTRGGNSEANASLNTNADLLISNISGDLFIGEDFEVANNGLDGGYAGTASCTATAILNNIGTVSIGCDFEIGFYTIGTNTQSVPSSITVNGSAEVRDVTSLSVADNLDVAFLQTDSDTNVFAGTTMSSIGSLVLDNVAEFAVDDRTRIGVHNDSESAMPTTGADIEVDGQLKMTATSFATACARSWRKTNGYRINGIRVSRIEFESFGDGVFVIGRIGRFTVSASRNQSHNDFNRG